MLLEHSIEKVLYKAESAIKEAIVNIDFKIEDNNSNSTSVVYIRVYENNPISNEYFSKIIDECRRTLFKEIDNRIFNDIFCTAGQYITIEAYHSHEDLKVNMDINVLKNY